MINLVHKPKSDYVLTMGDLKPGKAYEDDTGAIILYTDEYTPYHLPTLCSFEYDASTRFKEVKITITVE